MPIQFEKILNSRRNGYKSKIPSSLHSKHHKLTCYSLCDINLNHQKDSNLFTDSILNVRILQYVATAEEFVEFDLINSFPKWFLFKFLVNFCLITSKESADSIGEQTSIPGLQFILIGKKNQKNFPLLAVNIHVSVWQWLFHGPQHTWSHTKIGWQNYC